MTIRLLIVDDHEVVRTGVAALLAGPEIEVAGMADDGEAALKFVSENAPDVVLLDVRMQGTDGLETLDRLRNQYPELPVVMLSTYDNPTYVARAVAMGASDYVLKGDSRQQMIEALQRAVSGEGPSGESILRRVRNTMSGPGKGKDTEHNLPLTNRELQVLRHTALGLSNKEIARSLSISVETVKEHVQNILRKLNAADRTDAAVRAVKLGLV
jgi:DNA-binding NarL/FixJ family response regulator